MRGMQGEHVIMMAQESPIMTADDQTYVKRLSIEGIEVDDPIVAIYEDGAWFGYVAELLPELNLVAIEWWMG